MTPNDTVDDGSHLTTTAESGEASNNRRIFTHATTTATSTNLFDGQNVIEKRFVTYRRDRCGNLAGVMSYCKIFISSRTLSVESCWYYYMWLLTELLVLMSIQQHAGR